MQLTPTTPPGAIALPQPIDAKPGAPMSHSVLLTAAPTSNPFPGTGYGISGWLLPSAGRYQAMLSARTLSLSTHTAMAVVEHAKHAGTTYAVAPLVRLRWEAGGYGGTFTEHAARLGNSSTLYAVDRAGRRASIVAVADGQRFLRVARETSTH